ncbi:hypothetical protein LG634_13930 [Streptomyces bambusae]|uniref:hypothetical protein n=1 Tax=Streptomyces bambusae TaxID=1550616 RepID=UPI001CFD6DC5|nr:hypothetical protein [Streptomyces bambusae]MCB5165931.1 hypothetical protein [Streptomyces bambusae]
MSFGEEPFPQHPQTPDWEALADAHAARRRRRRLLGAGAAALTAVVLAGVVAGALYLGRSGGRDASDTPGAGPTASEPVFSAAPDASPHPLDHLADAKRDGLPFNATEFFPGKSTEISGRKYAQTAGDTKTDCRKAAPEAVAKVLARHGCRKLVRGTYQRDGVATTVGVAAFDTTDQAAKAKDGLPGAVTALQPSKGRKACAKPRACLRTVHAYGRFLYVTLSGFQSGKAAKKQDLAVGTAGDDLAEYAFQRIVKRGRTLAEAAAGH